MVLNRVTTNKIIILVYLLPTEGSRKKIWQNVNSEVIKK